VHRLAIVVSDWEAQRLKEKRDVMALSFNRYCTQVVAETELLRSAIKGADLSTAVSSCPGWNVGQLLRHLGGAHRWAAAAVRGRIREPLPEDEFVFRDLSGFTDEVPAELDPWLAEGAAELAQALRAAGPGVRMWTPVPSAPTTDFYARRFTHETLVHRADAALALGADYDADLVVVADAIDEWLELGSLPIMFEYHPETKELLGPGRTLHLHATDTPPELHADWVIDLTGDAIAWRRAHERAAVAVRGSLTELLLLIYRRRPVDAANIEVLGDDGLLDFWIERVSFG
jgi:uncharacterized protein (TIGR03083 family)